MINYDIFLVYITNLVFLFYLISYSYIPVLNHHKNVLLSLSTSLSTSVVLVHHSEFYLVLVFNQAEIATFNLGSGFNY